MFLISFPIKKRFSDDDDTYFSYNENTNDGILYLEPLLCQQCGQDYCHNNFVNKESVF